MEILKYFADRHRIEFPLLADPDNKVTKAYGVYKMKSLYGREYMGIERTTMIIDRDGIIRKVFPKVKVNGATATELATDLGTLLTFERSGVRYLLVGSVTPAAIEAVARGL